MAIQIRKENVSSLRKLAERGERAINSLRRVREEGEHVMEKVLRTGETSATAFGFGILNGYHGPVTVLKMPLELVTAGALELAGYLGLAGKHSDHLNNIGDGALAAFAVIKGVQVGAEVKAKHAAGSLGTSSSQAQVTASKGNVLAPHEIQAMVEQAVAANKVP